MKEIKAREILDMFLHKQCDLERTAFVYDGNEIWEAVRIARDALEKQIEKEPYYSGDGYWNGELVYDTWQCPNCEEYYEVDYDDYDHCPKCGQKISQVKENYNDTVY